MQLIQLINNLSKDKNLMNKLKERSKDFFDYCIYVNLNFNSGDSLTKF
jgi:hypothetical protein